MENIIRLSELKDFVAETLNEIREGVAIARATNLICELPEEVQFSVVLVREFQALELIGGQNSQSTEEQGGGSKEVSNGVTAETRVNHGTQDRTETARGTKNDSQVVHGVDDTSGNENASTNSNDESVTTNVNAHGHDQSSVRETTRTT